MEATQKANYQKTQTQESTITRLERNVERIADANRKMDIKLSTIQTDQQNAAIAAEFRGNYSLNFRWFSL